jgi:hypothetical protein
MDNLLFSERRLLSIKQKKRCNNKEDLVMNILNELKSRTDIGVKAGFERREAEDRAVIIMASIRDVTEKTVRDYILAAKREKKNALQAH